MTRGLKQACRWRKAFWIRESPGVVGGSAFIALPLLFFLPLEKLSFFGERLKGVAVLTWIFAIALALAIRGGQSLRDETSIWTVQKGLSLGEIALEDWILDMGLLAGASLWSAVVGFLAMRGAGPSAFLPAVAFFALGLTTGFITHSVTLFLSAFGVKRPSDPVALLAVVSILIPALTLEAPVWITALVEWIIPPFQVAIGFSGAIRVADLGGMTGALLHILLYSGIILSLGLWRISVWRPRA
jgi:hypothetical protein